MTRLRFVICLAGFFQSIETIGVSRDDTKSRQTAVKELQYRTITTRGQWPHICIFPEGTELSFVPFFKNNIVLIKLFVWYCV